MIPWKGRREPAPARTVAKLVGAVFLTLSCAILIFGAASPLEAREPSPGLRYSCQAGTGIEVTVDQVLAPDFAWDCEGRGWQRRREATWLSFSLPAEGPPPNILTFWQAHFDRADVYAISGGRITSRYQIVGIDVDATNYGPFASINLRGVTAETDRVIVRLERPFLSSVGSSARLVADEREAGFDRATALILAALAGLVVMPLLFDLGLYGILRQRFMLAHAGMCFGMLLVMNAANGLFAAMVSAKLSTLLTLTQLGYIILVGSAGVFVLTFVEKGILSRFSHNAVKAGFAIMLLTSGVLVLKPDGFGIIDQNLYMLGFLPLQLAVVWAVIQAVSRGSRLVWFIIVGWVPALLTGLDMVMHGLGLQSVRHLVYYAPFLAMVFEVCVTSIGVVMRILTLRQERDAALQDKQNLENISQRDPLTGLFNRRAIRHKFDELVKSGFTAMAIYDIDDFKSVNDDFGHDTGDEVLVQMAKALAPGADAQAMRLGGEEFLLLLRGANALERAEMRRTELTTLVQRSLPEVGRRVTASMGLLLFRDADDETKRDFNGLYAAADKLLYQAKKAGKNTYQFDILEADEAPDGAAAPA